VTSHQIRSSLKDFRRAFGSTLARATFPFRTHLHATHRDNFPLDGIYFELRNR
jgi:hypothetical protein